MYGYVYLTTCDVTGKYYVGHRKWNKEYTDDEYALVPKETRDWFETNLHIKAFPLDTDYFGSGRLILSDIRTYGKEHFHVQVLDIGYNRSDLVDKETFCINKYRTDGYDMYNLSNYGNTGFDPDEMSAEDKEFHIQRLKHLAKELDFASRFPDVSGENNGRYGKPVSDITRLRISKANSGRIQSPEEREARRKSHMEKCPHIKPPDCTGCIYVNNVEINKQLWPYQIEEFMKNNPGWVRGRVKGYKICRKKD